MKRDRLGKIGILVSISLFFSSLVGLKTEALEKFIRYKPVSLGQAGRIEGVTPGDLSVLSVQLLRYKALNDVQ